MESRAALALRFFLSLSGLPANRGTWCVGFAPLACMDNFSLDR